MEVALGIDIDMNDIWQICSDLSQKRLSGPTWAAEGRRELNEGGTRAKGLTKLCLSENRRKSGFLRCYSAT